MDLHDVCTARGGDGGTLRVGFFTDNDGMINPYSGQCSGGQWVAPCNQVPMICLIKLYTSVRSHSGNP